MNFRQRIAWVMVVLYLAGTFAVVWYVFEINDHYNALALDHVQKFHQSNADSYTNEGLSASQRTKSIPWMLLNHLADVPLPMWMLIFLLPYLQIFLMILACTRAQPKLSMAYLWPGLVYIKYQQLFRKQPSSIIPINNSTKLTNGYTVIHT